jgi:hypothetical protein
MNTSQGLQVSSSSGLNLETRPQDTKERGTVVIYDDSTGLCVAFHFHELMNMHGR